MAKSIEGKYDGAGKRFAIATSRFNSFIADSLQKGAIDCLVRHGVADDDITVVKVPGSFELPLVADKLTRTGKFDAVICLGVLIRGATSHFDWIAAETTKGIATASLASGCPVAFGVLTTDTIEQAIERGGTKAGNKGAQAAMAALEMANLYEQLDGI